MENALDLFSRNFSRKSLLNHLFGFDNDITEISHNFIDLPKVNIKETDEAYEIAIAVPGIARNQANIRIEDHVLYVSVKQEEEKEEKNDDEKYHVRQWSSSSFDESWNVPENVIESEIRANCKEGMLTIILPKKEITLKHDNSRNIEIE